MHDVLNNKDLHRREYLNKRKALETGYVLECEKKIRNTFYSLNIDASNIMLYISHDKEISLNEIKDSLPEKVNFSVPYVNENNMMVAVRIRKDTAFVKGKYGILIPEKLEVIDKKLIDLIFVPGIVFDNKGNRIGYGKGYYDRFLIDSDAVKVGCCYSWQIIDELDCSECHDIKMDYLLTEKAFKKLL